MRILLLCNKPPYPASEGGPMAMNSIITGLLEAGHQVKILAINNEKYHVKESDIPEEYKQKTGIELIDVDLAIKPLYAFLNLFTRKSYHVERFISEDFKARLTEVLEKEQFDVVQLEVLFMAPYVETIRAHSKAMIVLRAHNVEHKIWERVAKETRSPIKRWYIFFRKYCSKPVIDIPFGVYPEQFTPKYEVSGKPKFYHIGSMNWMPNEEGIRWFINEVLPKTVEKVPDFVYHLAGRSMPEWLTTMKDPHVDVIGEVPDAKEFVTNHDVAIVPLLSGSGIRIKIIESMALGKTVITTRVGAEGILYDEEVNIIIAENKAKMVEAIRSLNENPETAVKIGQAARKLVEETYDNRKIITRLLMFYEQIKPGSKISFL